VSQPENETIDQEASETKEEAVVESTEAEVNVEQDMPETESGERDLHAELEEVIKQSAANKEGWQRARAEFANYKKRAEREKQEGLKRGALDALTKLLPIFDDFERAMENVPEEMAENPWVSGTSLILRKYEKILDEYDVIIIDPVGELFDPRMHEAIGMDDSGDVESGHVTMTLQKGYMSGDRVLRPALVRVAS